MPLLLYRLPRAWVSRWRERLTGIAPNISLVDLDYLVGGNIKGTYYPFLRAKETRDDSNLLKRKEGSFYSAASFRWRYQYTSFYKETRDKSLFCLSRKAHGK